MLRLLGRTPALLREIAYTIVTDNASPIIAWLEAVGNDPEFDLGCLLLRHAWHYKAP
jgi:hypothetical protein